MPQTICKLCGYPLDDSLNFCPGCGVNLQPSQQAQTGNYYASGQQQNPNYTPNNSSYQYAQNQTPREDASTQQYYNASSGENPAEKILSFVAYASLILWLLLTLGYATVMLNTIGSYMEGWQKFLLFIVVILIGAIVSAISWAMCMILVNISTNIRHIKNILAIDSKANVQL